MTERFSLRTRLLSLTVLLSFISIAVGALAFLALREVSAKYSLVVSSSVPKIQHSDEMYLQYSKVRIALRTLGLPGISDSAAQQAIRDTEAAIELYEKSHKAFLQIGLTSEEEHLNKKLEAAWSDFKETGTRVIALHRSGTPENQKKMLEIFFTECPEKAKIYAEAVSAVVEFQRKTGKGLTELAQAEVTRDFTLMAFVIVAGLILSLALGLYFSSQITATLQSVAQSLTTGSSSVSAEVSQLTHSSEELSQAVYNQSSAIQQTSSSVEEIRAMVEKNSQNATSSAQSSEQSKNQAERGQKVVEEMIHSMGQIESSNKTIMDEITESNRRIAEIVQVIQGIESKTKVINDIVFQTKLLSFNASVEAARAGEQGKGFAVVAEEVGNLAQMSGNAAKEISGMLNESVEHVEKIVRDTKGRVETLIADSKSTVSRGGEIARQCGEVLGEIVNNARNVSSMVGDISSASTEQSKGVAEIARAIQDLDRSTQVNSSAAQLTASSATALGSQLSEFNGATEKLRAVVYGINKSKAVARFVWSDKFALGVHEMDAEHKILIEKINKLAAGLESGNSATILPLFQDLEAYTKEHFSDEENYMASIGYPDLNGHKAIHTKVLAGIANFGYQAKRGTLDGEQVVAFLNDWLIRHILGVDMKYAKFSQEPKSSFRKSA